MKLFVVLFALSTVVLAQNECKDDPNGDVAAAGVSCGILKGMGCDIDLQTLQNSLPIGSFVKVVCPKTCDNCPAADGNAAPAAVPAAAPAAPSALDASSKCKDDPTGEVASAGVSCMILKGMGCAVDLQTLKPDLAVGTLVSVVCPKTCDSCPVVAPAVAPATAPAAPKSDDDKSAAPAPAPAPPAPAPPAPEPVMCCMAMTASCLSCSAGSTVEDYCKANPSTAGCEAKEACPVCPKEKSCPTAEKTKFLVRSYKNTNMCVTAGALKKRISLKKCDAKNAAQHWSIDNGTMQNSVGCVDNKMMMAEKCDAKGVVTLAQQNGVAHHIKLGQRCLNMKGPKLNHLKCNKKARTQGWVFQVQM